MKIFTMLCDVGFCGSVVGNSHFDEMLPAILRVIFQCQVEDRKFFLSKSVHKPN
jgi:hypothetical protein